MVMERMISYMEGPQAKECSTWPLEAGRQEKTHLWRPQKEPALLTHRFSSVKPVLNSQREDLCGNKGVLL